MPQEMCWFCLSPSGVETEKCNRVELKLLVAGCCQLRRPQLSPEPQILCIFQVLGATDLKFEVNNQGHLKIVCTKFQVVVTSGKAKVHW